MCSFVGVQRGETRGGVLRVRFLPGDHIGVPRRGGRPGLLRVNRTGDGATFSLTFSLLAGAGLMIGFMTEIFPAMGLIAVLARMGCFWIGRDTRATASPIGTSQDFIPATPSNTSHSSLSASAVFLIAFDFTGMQYIELISNS